MTRCPRCGDGVATGQEYCLACGLRLADSTPAVSAGTRWLLRAGLGAVVALAGAALAIAATDRSPSDAKLITATGGFVTAPTTTTSLPEGGGPGTQIGDWPVGEDGWTVVLASISQTEGRPAAIAHARKALARKLPQVGVLDSSRYASLHPGYWVVFSGLYSSEAEATSALETARRVSRTATVRRVVP
jgi:hypothetical protein